MAQKKPLRISIIGAGPAGLYTAILARQHLGDAVIEVIEPNRSEEEEFKKSMQEMNISWGLSQSEAEAGVLDQSEAREIGTEVGGMAEARGSLKVRNWGPAQIRHPLMLKQLSLNCYQDE